MKPESKIKGFENKLLRKSGTSEKESWEQYLGEATNLGGVCVPSWESFLMSTRWISPYLRSRSVALKFGNQRGQVRVNVLRFSGNELHHPDVLWIVHGVRVQVQKDQQYGPESIRACKHGFWIA
jgi:hypothetical protein